MIEIALVILGAVLMGVVQCLVEFGAVGAVLAVHVPASVLAGIGIFNAILLLCLIGVSLSSRATIESHTVSVWNSAWADAQAGSREIAEEAKNTLRAIREESEKRSSIPARKSDDAPAPNPKEAA